MRQITKFSAALLTAALLSTSAFAADIRIGLQDDADVLDPAQSRTFVGRLVYTSMCDKLVDLDNNLTVVPPGKTQCPLHSHHGEEEMFFILEGEGELRFGDQRHAIRAHDVIACPTGGPDVAHQIINTGTKTMRYLAVSTRCDLDACEYPDSGKVLVVARRDGTSGLRKLFRAETTVDYYDREPVDGN